MANLWLNWHALIVMEAELLTVTPMLPIVYDPADGMGPPAVAHACGCVTCKAHACSLA